MLPAVVPFAVVEIDEPQALGLETQLADTIGPLVDDLLELDAERRAAGIVLLEIVDRVCKRFGLTHGFGRHVLDSW